MAKKTVADVVKAARKMDDAIDAYEAIRGTVLPKGQRVRVFIRAQKKTGERIVVWFWGTVDTYSHPGDGVCVTPDPEEVDALKLMYGYSAQYNWYSALVSDLAITDDDFEQQCRLYGLSAARS